MEGRGGGGVGTTRLLSECFLKAIFAQKYLKNLSLLLFNKTKCFFFSYLSLW